MCSSDGLHWGNLRGGLLKSNMAPAAQRRVPMVASRDGSWLVERWTCASGHKARVSPLAITVQLPLPGGKTSKNIISTSLSPPIIVNIFSRDSISRGLFSTSLGTVDKTSLRNFHITYCSAQTNSQHGFPIFGTWIQYITRIIHIV